MQARTKEELDEWYEYYFIGNDEYDRQLAIIESNNAVDEKSVEPDASGEPDASEIKVGILGELPSDQEYNNVDGTITRIHYYRGENDKLMKRVQTIKKTNVTQKVLKRVIERRNLPTFRSRIIEWNDGEKPKWEVERDVNYSASSWLGGVIEFKLASNSTEKKERESLPVGLTLRTCRECGQSGHWTADCPMKEMLGNVKNMMSSYDNDEDDDTTNKYVPPGKRRTTKGVVMNSLKIESKTNIKVSNITEEATHDDLRELFGRFGDLKKVTLVTDRRTGLSRGYGYIDFYNEDNAAEAMNKLYNYPYGNQILELSWAKVRNKN